jgi:hypothetical protein
MVKLNAFGVCASIATRNEGLIGQIMLQQVGGMKTKPTRKQLARRETVSDRALENILGILSDEPEPLMQIVAKAVCCKETARYALKRLVECGEAERIDISGYSRGDPRVKYRKAQAA